MRFGGDTYGSYDGNVRHIAGYTNNRLHMKNFLVRRVELYHIQAETEDMAIDYMHNADVDDDAYLVEEQAYDITVRPGEDMTDAIERTIKSL